MDTNLILHPTDGSEGSQKALDVAARLAANGQGKLIVLHVQRRHGMENVPPELADLNYVEHVRMTEADVLRGNAELLVERVKQSAEAKGVRDVEAVVAEGDPVRVILDMAKDRNVDMIVTGSRGRGDLEGLMLGSVSHKLVQLAPCTCVIVR